MSSRRAILPSRQRRIPRLWLRLPCLWPSELVRAIVDAICHRIGDELAALAQRRQDRAARPPHEVERLHTRPDPGSALLTGRVLLTPGDRRDLLAELPHEHDPRCPAVGEV